MNNREYLNKMFEASKKIGAAQERLKDKKQNRTSEMEIQISIIKDGFQIHHENKTFICQTGEQLVNYLNKLEVSQEQLLGVYDGLLLECFKRGIDFPTHII